jgi:hypothetical protein
MVEPPARLASLRHTLIVLAILAAIAVGGLLSGGRADTAAPVNRLPTYAVLAAGQLALVLYVRAGLRRQGRSLAREAGLVEVPTRAWLLEACGRRSWRTPPWTSSADSSPRDPDGYSKVRSPRRIQPPACRPAGS